MKHPALTFPNNVEDMTVEEAHASLMDINSRALALIRQLSLIPNADGSIPAVNEMYPPDDTPTQSSLFDTEDK